MFKEQYKNRILMAVTALTVWLSSISVVQANELYSARLQKYVSGTALHSQSFGEDGIAHLRDLDNFSDILNAFIFDTYIVPDRVHLLSEYNQSLGNIEERKNEILDGIGDVLAVVDGAFDILDSTRQAVVSGKPPSDIIYMAAARLTGTTVEVNIPYESPSSLSMAIDALIVCVYDVAETTVFVNDAHLATLLQDCAVEINAAIVTFGTEAVLNDYFSKETSESFGSLTGDMVRIAGECAISSYNRECVWSLLSQGIVWGSEITFNLLALWEVREEEIDLILKLAVYDLVEAAVKFDLDGTNRIAADYFDMNSVDGVLSYYGPAIGKVNQTFDNALANFYAGNMNTPVGGTIFETETIETVFNDMYLDTIIKFNEFKANLAHLPPLLPELNQHQVNSVSASL